DVANAYRKRVCWALALTLLVAATGTLPAWFQRYAVDWAIFPTRFDPLANKSVPVAVPFEQRIHWLVIWVLVITAAVLVNEILSGIRLPILAMVGTRVTADLRPRVYAHMHDRSLCYFPKRRPGSLMPRLTHG